MAIFQLLDGSRGRSVSIQIDKNLALLVILALYQPVRDSGPERH
jgi:hypothetical protein